MFSEHDQYIIGEKQMTAPPKNKRIQQKEETGELILKTAKRLFLELGYEKTTLRKIAEMAGLGTGTAFTHFPDKPSLLAATLHQDIEDVLQKAYETLSPESSPIEMLVYPIQAIYSHFSKTPALAKIWIKETLFLKGPWGDLVDEQFARSTEQIKLILQNAQAQGVLSPQSDCEVLATGILSHYLSTLIYGLKNSLDVDTQVSIYQALIESQLRPLSGGTLTNP
jgi:AcrR family transcriptional regulator